MNKKIFISSEPLEKFQWNFQDRCDLQKYLKSQKNTVLTFLWKINVWKNHSGGQIDSPAFFELKTSSKFKREKFFTRGSHAFQEKGGVWGSVSVCVWVCFCVCVSCVEEGDVLKGGKRKSIEITPLFYMCSAK